MKASNVKKALKCITVIETSVAKLKTLLDVSSVEVAPVKKRKKRKAKSKK